MHDYWINTPGRDLSVPLPKFSHTYIRDMLKRYGVKLGKGHQLKQVRCF